jgi:hypothetical protein
MAPRRTQVKLWPDPGAREGLGPAYTRPVRRHVDYTLARRAALRDLGAGRRDRADVCDAHPELLRAGRNLGERVKGVCPVCNDESLRLVSYVYGEGLRQANGRCISSEGELAKLERDHEEFSRYVVEVCVDCGWNHLQRHELHGRRHAAEIRPRPTLRRAGKASD